MCVETQGRYLNNGGDGAHAQQQRRHGLHHHSTQSPPPLPGGGAACPAWVVNGVTPPSPPDRSNCRGIVTLLPRKGSVVAGRQAGELDHRSEWWQVAAQACLNGAGGGVPNAQPVLGLTVAGGQAGVWGSNGVAGVLQAGRWQAVSKGGWNQGNGEMGGQRQAGRQPTCSGRSVAGNGWQVVVR